MRTISSYYINKSIYDRMYMLNRNVRIVCMYSLVAELVDSLLKELKKLDDKQMLTETHLTEARIYHALQNIPKCKANRLLCSDKMIYVRILQTTYDVM